MCPIAYAIVSTVSPKANDTPRSPIPTCGTAAARTALPQPPRTSQNVRMKPDGNPPPRDPNPPLRPRGAETGPAAAAEDQPERADELRRHPPRHGTLHDR